MSQNDFQEDLIKGRIAETVFEQMFRETTNYDVYPLGYEHTVPILCQFRDHYEYVKHEENRETIKKILDNFSNAPDFLITKPDKSKLYIVEVKYRSSYNAKEIEEIAAKIKEKWEMVWLFLATKERFYFGSCTDTIKNNGQMKYFDWISPEKQQKYLKLIQEYEK